MPRFLDDHRGVPTQANAAGAAGFHGILYPRSPERVVHAEPLSPAALQDLGLDRVLEEAASGRLTRDVLAAPLRDEDAVRYRQEVMRELEAPEVHEAVTGFRRDLQAARVRLGGEAPDLFPYARERARLDAAGHYVRAAGGLAAALDRQALASRALVALRARLQRTVESPAFRSLADDCARVAGELSELHYALLVEGRSVTVRPFRAAGDLRQDVETLFGRFVAGPPPQADVRAYLPAGRSRVQAHILRRLATLHPRPFEELTRFAAGHRDFLDPVLERFADEVGVYLDYLAYIAPLRRAGLPFCYPEVGRRGDDGPEREVDCRDSFDLALARRLVAEERRVVPNAVTLRGGERLLVVTGPNQGGKTTYARTFGQLHYLAALGCPVPGRVARVGLFDRLLTHFERGERVRDERGRLADELTRVRRILEVATTDSLVVLNETFSSTTLADARFLAGKLLGRLSRLDLRAAYVTFVDELADFDDKTVSVVATVDPEDPEVRTFELVRGPADGAAHALAIARKRGVSYEQLLERLPS